MPKAGTFYTPELADEILGLLSEGVTLTKLCGREGMPTTRAVNNWVREDREGFAGRYRDARFVGACMMVDAHKDETDACDTEQKARILDSKTRALRAIIPVLAPTLMAEPPPPPQEHRFRIDWGPAPPLPEAVKRVPMIEGEFREVRDGD